MDEIIAKLNECYDALSKGDMTNEVRGAMAEIGEAILALGGQIGVMPVPKPEPAPASEPEPEPVVAEEAPVIEEEAPVVEAENPGPKKRRKRKRK